MAEIWQRDEKACGGGNLRRSRSRCVKSAWEKFPGDAPSSTNTTSRVSWIAYTTR
ncbi:hypothetical protein [Phormidium sp. CCY1219]|uniref:hypothetical protein n=1 Tax=Phormidium sp. CCY1219 TaxID=2886104 RepID=UPI002D1F0626|nr:hypothetical protein [Phormidium sp. CCY1219]MEB3826433.1 hypothetical protein [Phormidium sp. CCY1219]